MFNYQQMQTLNELEMTIYNYIITHAAQVSKMTIRQLVDILHVSSTTILRFCAKLGYDGWSEFKFRLKEYVKEANPRGPTDDFSVIENFFQKVKDGDFDQQIDQIAHVLAEKERVFFLGIGTSGTLGKYGAHYLSNYGKYAMHMDDPFYPMGNSSYEDTAVVVLSVSGE